MKTLNARQRDVLRAVIEEYIRTAEPVGSRTLSRMEGFNISPATIRNEMADLEAAGYIAPTHHSSGRMPTERGLRYYVDHLLDVERLRREEEARLAALCESAREKRALLKNALVDFSRALSELTRYPGLLLLADGAEPEFRKVQFLRLDPENVLVTLVSTVGGVSNHVARAAGPDQESLNALARRLNEGKRAFNAAELSAALAALVPGREVAGLPVGDDSVYHEALLIEGVLTLFDHKEFRTSPERIARMLELIESKRTLARVLASILSRGADTPEVRIGRELEGLEDLGLSVAGAAVSRDGRPLGALGLVGPSRMEYGRVLGLLEIIAKAARDLRDEPDGA